MHSLQINILDRTGTTVAICCAEARSSGVAHGSWLQQETTTKKIHIS
jgi:hypothetical protein